MIGDGSGLVNNDSYSGQPMPTLLKIANNLPNVGVQQAIVGFIRSTDSA